jgi:sugar transferase (PEP-CTERM system associated)
MVRILNQYVSVKGVLLILLEGMLIVLCVVLGAKLRFWNDPAEFEEYIALPRFAFQAGIIMIVFQACFYYADLYNFAQVRNRFETLTCLGQAIGAASLILGLAYYLVPALLVGRGVFFITVGVVICSFLITRVVLDSIWRVAMPKEKTLILGARDLALNLAAEMSNRQDLNVELVGFVSDHGGNGEAPLIYPLLGGIGDLESIVAERQIQRIIVAMENQRGALPVRELVKIRVQGVRVEDAQSVMSALTGRIWLETVKPSWFVFSDGFLRSRFSLFFKRLGDIFFGTLGLLISLPVMIVVAILIRLESKGPVIYRQERVGLYGKTFNVLKFRSMRIDAEAGGVAQWAQKDDPRVTLVGKYIRKFRIDEFPQFINVIRGDMSFVGPRPERPVFVEQLRNEIAYYDERHSVRPGVTGWAQVRYPYGSSAEDAFRKLEYDLFYLKNMSFAFDWAIIFQTLRTVLTGEGSR